MVRACVGLSNVGSWSEAGRCHPPCEGAGAVVAVVGCRGLVPRCTRVPGCVSFGRRHRRVPADGFRDGVLWQQGVAGHRLWKKLQEGNRHREVTGSSRGKGSEVRNPMGAIGMKQGRKGSRRSGRRETVRNRTCRLPGRGMPGMTCRFVPHASKGNKPQERCWVA